MSHPIRSILMRDRPWLNGLLFAVTFLSAAFVGLSWSSRYIYPERWSGWISFKIEAWLFWDSRILLLSVLYAMVLMAILLAHEMGHYCACRRHGLDATLPFFMPVPTRSLIGTFGAFIKIRSPIERKKQLFDIGIAGPLAGFVLAVPALAIGLALSKVVPDLPRKGDLQFGYPLLMKILISILFPNFRLGSTLVLHPVAFAGWVGVLVTALNLIPVGQLDGGHITYSIIGRHHLNISRFVLMIFLLMAWFYWLGWLVLFIVLILLKIRHPKVIDEMAPLDRTRRILFVAVVVIFILSFIPAPVEEYNILDFIRSIR